MNSQLLLGEILPEPTRGEIFSDEAALRLAIQEAFKGAGRTSPNPLVGCVILDSNNRFLTKAYHEALGGLHAEANALKNLDPEQIKEAKVFVTLEPCAHEGRTPSCAKALAALPIQRVVFGLLDPNPLVAGQGAEIIKKAGIQVSSFVFHPDLEKKGILYHLKNSSQEEQKEWESLLEQTCEHFLWNFKNQSPFVSLKVAASLDGQMALKKGESKWITGEASRNFSHFLRAFHDATLVGAGTVMTDNPSLNIRHPLFQNKDNKKENKIVVLDPKGRCLRNCLQLNLFKNNPSENIFFFVSSQTDLSQIATSLKSSGIQIIALPGSSDQLDLHLVLKKLWDLNIKSVFVEGGAKILSSFLQEKLSQRLYLFTAPIIIGAGEGRSWTGNFSINSLNDRIIVKNQRFMALEKDQLFSGTFDFSSLKPRA